MRASVRGKEVESKSWKDGSVEAGKSERNEDITTIEKCVCVCMRGCVCVYLLYCSGPTYPSILLRRHSPKEEG